MSDEQDSTGRRIPGWALILVVIGMFIVIGMGFYLAITTPQGTDADGNTIPEIPEEIEVEEDVDANPEPEVDIDSVEATAIEAAEAIIDAISTQNEEVLEAAANEDGVRFSPSAFVNVSADTVVTPTGFNGFFADSTESTWGNHAGSGDPIVLTNQDYWNEFVYPRDFISEGTVGEDIRQATSSTIDNSGDVYPGATIVEYYIPPTEEGGLDWSSLRLALEQNGSDWFLSGVMMDLWTT